ncbi:MAG: AIPR family protein [Bryobacteraceae bacterium]
MPIFIANSDAEEYIQHAAKAGDQIDLWDLDRITPILNQVTQQQWFVREKSDFKVDPTKLYSQGDISNPDLVMAAISAKELVKLTGISDTRIFAQNVRLGLGKTRVNTELIQSIKDQQEHKNFLAYHNGLTIVARDILLTKGKISITDYSVSNGCQSLQSLYNNQSVLTNALILPVRIVKVGEDRSLAASIAYKTNNQNPISLRDLSANDSTQTQIKAEFDQLYGFDSSYMIKQRAVPTSKELSNEYAGRLLLSLYVEMPWSAHQKYKLFGELQAQIFKYGINAPHIRFAQLTMQACESALLKCQQEKVKQYGLTRFLLLYLVGQILRKSAKGRKLLDDPPAYLRTKQVDQDRGPLEADLMHEITSVASYVVTEINYYMEDHGGDAYDYKSDFKSEKSVKLIRSEVLKSYDKDRFRDKVDAFKLPKDGKSKASASKKSHKA